MITIASTATAVPPHLLSRELVKEYFGPTFGLSGRRLEAMLEVIDNSRIESRYSIFPADYLIEPRSLTKKNCEYRQHAIALGRKVTAQALDAAGMSPDEVDMIVSVSCTGFMIPSVDAYLVGEMGFRPDVRRLPITELGCAAGAVGLTRAWDHIRANPGTTVLLLAIELPTLTFQRGDLTQANLISAALFGDGAAAAVITGKGSSGPTILDSRSYTFPSSLDAMGFDLKDGGFHIVLSKEVPQLIRDRIRSLFDELCARHDLTLGDIRSFVLHPGGQKLLAFVQEELGLCSCQVQPSWDVLRNYGNLSSASVLFVLHEWMTGGKTRLSEHALLAAFGPGFSAEMLLLQWT